MSEAIQQAVNRPVDEAQGERLHKVEAVARQWDVGRCKIYELIKTGELRSIKIGGSRRIPDSALIEFIAQRSS